MHFMKSVLFIFFAIINYQAYAHENEYVLVGQNHHDGQADTAFVLELVGDNVDDYVHINESGEVYLKVDKIVAIPRGKTQFASARDVMYVSGGKCLSVGRDYEEDVGRYGRVDQPKRWQCPYCYHWWILGEKCQNPFCPVNNWNK